MSQVIAPSETADKTLLTYSALNTYRNCPRKYKNRYVDNLRPRERAEALSFGSVIHTAIELWYRSAGVESRLSDVNAYIDDAFENRIVDAGQMASWHLARAIIAGYAGRYSVEEFEVVEVEKEFVGEIRNPDTGRQSQTFRIAGKVDAIVRCHDGMYLLEHKTAAMVDANYLDKLWTDTQIALYCHYLRELGYPIVGVIYNVLLKARLKQSAGETQAEYEARHTELAAKNKSGKSTAKRQMPETDVEFQSRLTEWYSRPEAFHREFIYLSEDRLAMLQEEVWEITQQYLDARRRGKWLLNTSNCFSYQRPCEYLAYCQSGFNPNVADNITVEVVKIQGNRISLGIVAPSNVKILRGELTEQQAKAQIVELVVEDGLLVAC
ncbi:MAG: PD-(D/E)XK nuclease family protein [Pirellula sp.]